MKRRNPDAEFSGGAGPLFDLDAVQAMERAKERMEQAAGKAERVEPGWREAALQAVREHARTHHHFLAQDVPMHVPDEADDRAVGALMPEARRRGWITADGFGIDQYGSPKTRWRSLILNAAGTSPAARNP